MIGRSNALRMPVAAPRGTVYLTGLQWTIWWLLTRPRRQWSHGDMTLAKLADLTGSSRGRCWHALTRLRSLELVSWRAWPAMPLTEPPHRQRRTSPGCRGRLLVWIPPRAQAARTASLRAFRLGQNDSLSGTYGAYASARGAADAWRARRTGRRRDLAPRLDRPTPRRGPPRVVYGRCPVGHTVRLGRRSWIEGPEWRPSITATFIGTCRRCHALVSDGFELELPPEPGRGPSPAELADPATLERRRKLAAELLADPMTAPSLRERIRRDYVERPPDAPPWRPAAPESTGHLVRASPIWRAYLAQHGQAAVGGRRHPARGRAGPGRPGRVVDRGTGVARGASPRSDDQRVRPGAAPSRDRSARPGRLDGLTRSGTIPAAGRRRGGEATEPDPPGLDPGGDQGGGGADDESGPAEGQR